MRLSRISNFVRSASPGYRSGLKNVKGFSFCSSSRTPYPEISSKDTLYRRLCSLGNHQCSMVPVLDQWVQEGRSVYKAHLRQTIKKFRVHRRYKHALEISLWMSEKGYMELDAKDVGLHLELIARTHGINEAEQYLEAIPSQLRKMEVYNSLLNCYALHKCVEKAEATMQLMRDLGLTRTCICYNVMLKLYYQTRNHEKAARLLEEMGEEGIRSDHYTNTIRLHAYAASLDVDEMEKFLTEMENDPATFLNWKSYSVAANGYIRAGVVDKALAVLKKAERLLIIERKGKEGYPYLLTQYAAIGRKDELLRLWEAYRTNGKVYNNGYISVITSASKIDDLELVEKLFEEWESSGLGFDMRIPNFLISVYRRRGLLNKAEDLLNKIICDGNVPDGHSWYYMALGYLRSHQHRKALEAMKKSISICRATWKPDMEVITACLEYLKEKGDREEAAEFLNLLRVKGIITSDIQEAAELLSSIRERVDTELQPKDVFLSTESM